MESTDKPSNLAVFLASHKEALQWTHTALILALTCLPALYLRFALPTPWDWPAAAFIFACATLAFCQNIGLIHEFDHRVPKAPFGLGLAVVRVMHAAGGLRYQHARVAHGFHHLYLGTSQDPDRNGYNQMTRGVWRKLRYLLFIGPIRGKFAPVDLRPFLSKMSDANRARHFKMERQDAWILAATHLALLLICGLYYPVVFAALLFANMLSNIREMTEHGNYGKAAYVNIQPSLIGLLFFSTPGFWYHGTHHSNPEIHYWELPLKAGQVPIKNDLPFLRRRSYLRFLFSNA